MSDATPQVPVVPIVPDTKWPVSAPFWQAAAEGRLSFPQCRGCGAFEWYPVPMCKHCGSLDWVWPDVDPHGTIYSYTVLRRAFLDGVEANVPFPVLQARFDGAPGVSLVIGLADLAQRDAVQIGAPIKVAFVDVGGATMPFAEIVGT
jgi:uncharacterized OB-fold protein